MISDDFPTRESEAREWIEAAIMLLTKDGLDVVLTGVGRFTITEPQRVIGDLERLKWNAELTFKVGKGCEIVGFEAQTPEGFLLVRGKLHREKFPVAGIYTLKFDIDFYDFPVTTS